MIRKTDREILQRFKYRLELYKQGWNIDLNETPEQKQARINRARHDFAFFVKTYLHHYAIDPDTNQNIPTPGFHTQAANLIRRKRSIKIFLRWGRGLGKTSVLADLMIPFGSGYKVQISYMVLIGNYYDKAQILLSDLQWEFENTMLI